MPNKDDNFENSLLYLAIKISEQMRKRGNIIEIYNNFEESYSQRDIDLAFVFLFSLGFDFKWGGLDVKENL
ncbi:hypothetical protein [Listeria monocytogenes]|uniref:hypothetical protein n=1 Tax=Listeria monocytogenes TaxID=1639 RepID=UPI0010D5069A|nr:hypothetical protein [Listeria monocytogenes]EAE6914793.1 hypothetical protein [Listeria monocytogenes]EDO0252850.1 hypothetical protein [Listeria monocytogenes]EDO0911756.1 hypothetical protein [Listeria monocytogenes]EGD7122563.1 hypothetical protein [Listeria monocytogenes]EGS3236368.1 hypothetical protein [Listeria monocytogenes]